MNTLPKTYDCVAGGYSVWNCPTPKESKPPTPAKKTPWDPIQLKQMTMGWRLIPHNTACVPRANLTFNFIMKTLPKANNSSSQIETKNMTLGDLIAATYGACGKGAPKILQLAMEAHVIKYSRLQWHKYWLFLIFSSLSLTSNYGA